MISLRFSFSFSVGSGAGAFACRPCAGPRPIFGGLHKTGRHRIELDVTHDPVQLAIVADPTIERFVLPKGISSPAQNLVGLPRCRTFQPPSNRGQRNFRLQKQVHMIGHDHPGPQCVKAPLLLAVPEGISDRLRNTSISQPKRPASGLIDEPINSDERFPSSLAGGSACPTSKASWKRTGQTPSHKQEHSRLWLPMRQSSTIEHKKTGWRPAPESLSKC